MSDTTFEQMHGYYLEDLAVGMSAVYTRTLTEERVKQFAEASGDTNPLHLNEAFAAHTRFKKRIVHGMLTTSLWSTLVGTRLPGPGSAYMRQELKFIKPVHIGDTVTAKITVTRIDHEKQQAYLEGECFVAGTLVALGQGVVWVPRRESKGR
ncbi:MAG: MaoC family dehydratase [Thermodesulfobacteriota bacterium]